MPPNHIDDYFAPFMPCIRNWHEVCRELKLLPLDLALHFVVSQPYIDKVIIGISNLNQLKEIVLSIRNDRPSVSALSFSELGHNSEEFLNPALWNLKS